MNEEKLAEKLIELSKSFYNEFIEIVNSKFRDDIEARDHFLHKTILIMENIHCEETDKLIQTKIEKMDAKKWNMKDYLQP